MKNIKSLYFIKIILSYLHEKTKLEFVKYNKYVQKLIDVNIYNYRIMNNINSTKGIVWKGEYLNGKKNGKGKEKQIGEIIFEGEYLNGKRCGKGTEYGTYYAHGKILFEGEYLHGYKWNGKVYDIKGIFISELKNGKGHMKEYNCYHGALIFEGEYLNGKRHGKGKEYYITHDKDIEYEGEFLNGNRHGKGKEYNIKHQVIFEGEYLNGCRWNGKGYKDNKIIYELKEGKGFVKEYDPFIGNLLIFEGEYLYGRKKKGKEYDEDGNLIYEGEYSYEYRSKGKEYYLKGELLFEGEYLYDEWRKGKEYHFGRVEYEGEFLNNKKWDGKGYNKIGKVIYELNNGNGNVIEYSHDNDIIIFEGEYLNGERYGKGKEYDYTGLLKFEGKY